MENTEQRKETKINILFTHPQAQTEGNIPMKAPEQLTRGSTIVYKQ